MVVNLENDIKQSEAFSTFYTLKGDLQRANERISQQEAIIEQLKESAAHSLDIIPTKEKSNDLKNLILQIQKDFSDSFQKLKSLEDIHIGELVQKNQEIISLQNEIAELRHKIVIFESKKYENELMLVRDDLHKAVAERIHAKKLIISYIRSVQQLERMIYEKIDSESIPQMYKLEVNRLNEENKSLVDAKSKQEEFLEKEIKQLQIINDGQGIKIQELENKIDSINKIKIKENTDEIKSWIIKNKQLQELNRRLIDSLSNIESKNIKAPNGKKNPQLVKASNEAKSTIKQ